jgi:hypothetical protein
MLVGVVPYRQMALRTHELQAPRPSRQAPMSIGDPVRESLHCTQCVQPISALYVPSGPVHNFYQCPLCEAVMEVALPGTLIDWWAGHCPKTNDLRS